MKSYHLLWPSWRRVVLLVLPYHGCLLLITSYPCYYHHMTIVRVASKLWIWRWFAHSCPWRDMCWRLYYTHDTRSLRWWFRKSIFSFYLLHYDLQVIWEDTNPFSNMSILWNLKLRKMSTVGERSKNAKADEQFVLCKVWTTDFRL